MAVHMVGYFYCTLLGRCHSLEDCLRNMENCDDEALVLEYPSRREMGFWSM